MYCIFSTQNMCAQRWTKTNREEETNRVIKFQMNHAHWPLSMFAKLTCCGARAWRFFVSFFSQLKPPWQVIYSVAHEFSHRKDRRGIIKCETIIIHKSSISLIEHNAPSIILFHLVVILYSIFKNVDGARWTVNMNTIRHVTSISSTHRRLTWQLLLLFPIYSFENGNKTKSYTHRAHKRC